MVTGPPSALETRFETHTMALPAISDQLPRQDQHWQRKEFVSMSFQDQSLTQ